jgi:hypothetical protein
MVTVREDGVFMKCTECGREFTTDYDAEGPEDEPTEPSDRTVYSMPGPVGPVCDDCLGEAMFEAMGLDFTEVMQEHSRENGKDSLRRMG